MSEYMDAAMRYLDKLITNCFVEYELTPAGYSIDVRADVDSRFTLYKSFLVDTYYVQSCMRISNDPKYLAEEILLMFFTESLMSNYTAAGIKVITSRLAHVYGGC